MKEVSIRGFKGSMKKKKKKAVPRMSAARKGGVQGETKT